MIAFLALSARAEPLGDCPATVSGDPRLAGPAVIVVRKEARRLALYSDGKLAACFRAGLGQDYPEGHKVRMGDRRTPEGWYRTSDRPWSSFYHAITLHYPSAVDAAAALKDGRITKAQHDAIVAAERAGKEPPSETPLGGKILIHGGGGSTDWTLGCVALDDADIDALRAKLPSDLRTWVLVER